MKNMRSFSVVVLSTMLASMPIVAMDPGMEFPEVQGMEQASNAFYSQISAKASQGLEAAKGVYNENAPKVTSAVKGFAQEARAKFANAVGAAQAYATALNASETAAPVAPVAAEVPAVEAPVLVLTPAPVVEVVAPIAPKAPFSFKGFFNQMAQSAKTGAAQLKEKAQNHPVIAGVTVAAIVAIPVVSYLMYKKVQKNRKK